MSCGRFRKTGCWPSSAQKNTFVSVFCGCLCWQTSLWFSDGFARPLTGALQVKVGTEGKQRGVESYRTWRRWLPGFYRATLRAAKSGAVVRGSMQTTGSEVIYIDLCSVCTHYTTVHAWRRFAQHVHTQIEITKERRSVFLLVLWSVSGCVCMICSTGSNVRNCVCIVLACMYRLYIWPQVFDMSPLIFHMCCLSIYTVRGKPCRTCPAWTTCFFYKAIYSTLI